VSRWPGDRVSLTNGPASMENEKRYIIDEVEMCSLCPYIKTIDLQFGTSGTFCMKDETGTIRIDLLPSYPEIPDTCPLPKDKP
jgi:hypothetical protein